MPESFVNAGSILFEVGVLEDDLTALETRVTRTGEILSNALNQKPAEGRYTDLIKELELVSRRSEQGLASQDELAAAIKRVGSSIQRVTNESSGYEGRIARISERIRTLNSEISRGASTDKTRAELESLTKSLERVKTQSGLTQKNLLDISKGLGEAERGFKSLDKQALEPLVNSYKELSNTGRGLRSEFKATGQDAERITAELKEVRDEALKLADTVERGSTAWLRYRQTASQAEDTIRAINGQQSRLGLASQVQLGVQGELIGVLNQFGPAGQVASSALNGMGIAATPLSPLLLGVGGAALGALAGFAQLSRRGTPLLEDIQDSLNTLRANGIEDIDAVRQGVLGLQEDLGKAGRSFNRAQITRAIAETVKANRSEAESLEILAGSIQLAAAEKKELNATSLELSKVLRLYGFETDRAVEVTSKLVTAGNLADKEATSFAEGLGDVGNSAREAGFDLETTLGILTALDNNGLDPAQEGARALRAIIAGLSDPSQKARDILASLGIELKNMDGSTRPVKDVLFELITALEGNAEAGAIAFGLFDTLGANAVLGLGENVQTLTQDIRDSGDAIQDYTDTKLEGMRSAKERLSTAVDDLGTTLANFTAGPVADASDGMADFVTTVDGLLNGDVPDDNPLNYLIDRMPILSAAIDGPLNKLVQFQTFLNNFSLLDQFSIRNPFGGDDPQPGVISPTGQIVPDSRGADQSVPLPPGFEASSFSTEPIEAQTEAINENSAAREANALTLASLREELKGIQAELETTDINSDRFGELQKQEDALESQIKTLEGVETRSRKTAKATLTDEEKRQQAIQKTTETYQAQLEELNNRVELDLVVPGSSEALDSQLKTTETAINKLLPLYKSLTGAQKEFLSALIADQETLAVKSVFAQLAEDGAEAIRTSEDAASSVEARIKLVNGAISDLFRIGLDETDAQVEYLQRRLGELKAEFTQLDPDALVELEIKPVVDVAEAVDIEVKPTVTITPAGQKFLDLVAEGGAEFPVDVNVKVNVPAESLSEAARRIQNDTLAALREADATAFYESFREQLGFTSDTLDALNEKSRTVAEAQAARDAVELENIQKRSRALESLALIQSSLDQGTQSVSLIPEDGTPGLFDVSGFVSVNNDYNASLLETAELLRDLGQISDAEYLSALKSQEAALVGLIATTKEGSDEWKQYAADLASVRDEIEDLTSFDNVLKSLLGEAGGAGLKNISKDLKALARDAGLALTPLDNFENQISLLELSGEASAEEVRVMRDALALLRGEASETEALERLAELFNGLRESVQGFGAGSEIVSSVLDIAEGISRAASAGDNAEAKVQGLVSALQAAVKLARDLNSAARDFDGNDIYDAVASAISGVVEVLGVAVAGIPGLGQAANAVLQLVKLGLGDLSNGAAETERKIGQIAKSFDLLGESFVRSVSKTRDVSRGGLLGLLGLDRSALNEEATRAGAEIGNALASALLGAMETGLDGFGASVQQIIARELLKGFVLSAHIQGFLSLLTGYIQDYVEADTEEEREQAAAGIRNIVTRVTNDAEEFINDVFPDGVPGGGAGAPDGSIAAAEKELSDLREDYRNAETDGERRRLEQLIEDKQREIDRLKGEEKPDNEFSIADFEQKLADAQERFRNARTEEERAVIAEEIERLEAALERFRRTGGGPEQGSIDFLEAELAKEREKFNAAATDAERAVIQGEIDRLEDLIERARDANPLDPNSDAATFDLPPAIQFAISTPLVEASQRMLEAAELIHQTFSGPLDVSAEASSFSASPRTGPGANTRGEFSNLSASAAPLPSPGPGPLDTTYPDALNANTEALHKNTAAVERNSERLKLAAENPTKLDVTFQTETKRAQRRSPVEKYRR